MAANLLQFPIRQNVVLQCVEDGVIWYAYPVQYQYEGRVSTMYLWARDDADAASRFYAMTLVGTLGQRLKDNMELQNQYQPPVVSQAIDDHREPHGS